MFEYKLFQDSEHHKSGSGAVNRSYHDDSLGSSSGNESLYSKVKRNSKPHLFATSQPCSPLPYNSGSDTGSRSGKFAVGAKHGKSRSELATSGSQYNNTSIIVVPPPTKERLIYEPSGSVTFGDYSGKGSDSLLTSGATSQGSISGIGSHKASTSSSQDSRGGPRFNQRRESDRGSTDAHLNSALTSADESHIYDEVAEDDIRNRNVTSVLLSSPKNAPLEEFVRSSSLSDDKSHHPITPNSELKKKSSKLKKQKSFTKKWLSNKHSHNSASNMGSSPSTNLSESSANSSLVSGYFGQPLNSVMPLPHHPNEPPIPPLFVSQCIEFIEQFGKTVYMS